jgi:glycosyltransferase involved in cell wall biosynthesis
VKIAFFNWRDIRHPMAGGAELYVHSVLARLCAKGHSATLFTSRYAGAPERETIDGIDHVRYGGRFTIFAKSPLVYRRLIRNRYDIIVESINGVPFFTPLFAKEPVIPLIHQLTRENWYSALPAPVAFVGYHAEDTMLRIYSRKTAVAPSPSTKSDLERLGFKDVRVVYGSAGISPPGGVPKEAAPTLLYLGRLTKSKRVDHAIRAFAAIAQKMPDAVLWIAGSGPEAQHLASLASSLGISGRIRFFGRVGNRLKASLLSKAHLALFPAVREGWGLVVLEANACGTPVLGYDVPGLHDSIQEGVNGALVRDGDIAALAERAAALLESRKALAALSSSSKGYSAKFSWGRSADELEAILREALAPA